MFNFFITSLAVASGASFCGLKRILIIKSKIKQEIFGGYVENI